MKWLFGGHSPWRHTLLSLDMGKGAWPCLNVTGQTLLTPHERSGWESGKKLGEVGNGRERELRLVCKIRLLKKESALLPDPSLLYCLKYCFTWVFMKYNWPVPLQHKVVCLRQAWWFVISVMKIWKWLAEWIAHLHGLGIQMTQMSRLNWCYHFMSFPANHS